MTKIFRQVMGLDQRCNDIIFYSGKENNFAASAAASNKPKNLTLFFPGDCQNYKKDMESHHENRQFANLWNLERTAELLAEKFPGDDIAIVKASKMTRGTFACYTNFVESNDYGVPCHSNRNYGAWRHLNLLIGNLYKSLQYNEQQDRFSKSSMKLVAFSKGCVVLNQFLYELPEMVNQNDLNLKNFLSNISDFYLLDSGHNGGKDIWMTDEQLLISLSNMSNNVRVHVHLTPYQIHDVRRPWIGQEEQQFSAILSRLMQDRFSRQFYAGNGNIDINTHFQLLEQFMP